MLLNLGFEIRGEAVRLAHGYLPAIPSGYNFKLYKKLLCYV